MKMEQTMHSGTLQAQPSAREFIHAQLARRAAAEGMVLLKNEGLLPLQPSKPVALLGKGACMTVKGGTGSGDVNSRESVSIYQGLQEAGVTITSGGWLEDYRKRYAAARNAWREEILEDAKKVKNPFDAYAAHPFAMPEERLVCEDDIEGAEAAVYVVSRISGEGKDRRKELGDYYLSTVEQENLRYLDRRGIPVVLLLNTGGPVELTDILQETDSVKAILNISQPGQEGGRAAADVLLGKCTPCGKLTATWAKRYEDYPSAETFGYLSGDLAAEEYREGIFVGYRHFERLGIEPLFPFGFGLSYTSFAVCLEHLDVSGRDVRVAVTVKNTGEACAGREVVQIYASLPQTGLDKERRRLVGFAKTKLLRPGEAQTLSVLLPQKQFASFSPQKQGWIVETGEYCLWLETGDTDPQIAAKLRVTGEVMLEQTHACTDGPPEGWETERFPDGEREMKHSGEKPGEEDVPTVIFQPQREEKRTPPLCPAARQPVSELLPLLCGNITQGASNLGSAGVRVPGSAGETTEALRETCGIRSLVMADGPAGLRLRQSYEADRDTGRVYGAGVLGSLENGFLEAAAHHENTDTYYQYCAAFPVGTALAQTWDTGLMEEFGRAIAAEMEEFHVDLWLGPGMNIQRNPLCGRNFEYYSEDPLLSGSMAAAVTAGVQHSGGRGVVLKHFACNNREDNRMGADVRVSERALREIYLRGFEIAVKQSRPAALMSAYNKINGTYAANHYGLCTVIAREEWGFDGIIMSDWNTTVPKDGSVPWKCAAAGNDIIMPGSPKDAENIREALERGTLPEETVRNTAGRILALLDRLQVSEIS